MTFSYVQFLWQAIKKYKKSNDLENEYCLFKIALDSKIKYYYKSSISAL